MDQESLTKMFVASEKARAAGFPLDNGWGSSVSEDKDSLWDSNTDTHWERNRPDGIWEIVPPIGSDRFA